MQALHDPTANVLVLIQGAIITGDYEQTLCALVHDPFHYNCNWYNLDRETSKSIDWEPLEVSFPSNMYDLTRRRK